MQAHLHRVDLDVEELRRLLGAEALDVAQQEHAAVDLGPAVDAPAHELPHLAALDGVRVVRPPGRAGVDAVAIRVEARQQVVDRLLRLAAARAELHQAGVDHDAVQPGREARAPLEAADAAEGLQEGVLERVARVLLRSQHAARDREQAPAVGRARARRRPRPHRRAAAPARPARPPGATRCGSACPRAPQFYRIAQRTGRLESLRAGVENGSGRRTKGVAMSSLVRTRPASPTHLLMRILERPELVAAVRELPAPVIGRLIDRLGLEDAGELVALASGEQLRAVFDQHPWRASTPGEDEKFRPERFALWVEIMSEGGEGFLIEQLCALPLDLLTLAVHRLLLVVDMDALGQSFARPGADLERLERALDAALFDEWEEFRVLARDPMHWDAVWAALIALDRDHHDLLRAILERCCALSSEYIEEQGGLYEVLTSEEMLEGDVAGEREDRRAAEGYVAPADARSFLELARRGAQLETRDPITRAYFRALTSEKPRRPAESEARAARAELAAPAADVSKLVQLLEEAAVIDPVQPQPMAVLPAGPPAAKERGGRDPIERSSLPASDTRVLLLQEALAELRVQEAGLFSQRIAELGYLANVLVAGSRDRRPRPVEALEQAIAVCNTGLERALGAERTLTHAVAVLEKTPADQLFRRGFRG